MHRLKVGVGVACTDCLPFNQRQCLTHKATLSCVFRVCSVAMQGTIWGVEWVDALSCSCLAATRRRARESADCRRRRCAPLQRT